MSVSGWIIVSIIGLAITLAYTFIIKLICSLLIEEESGTFFSVLLGGPTNYTNPAATIITVFSGITSAIASVFAVMLYCKKIPGNIPVILIIYGGVVLCTIIQFIVRFIQDEIIYADDTYIEIAGIIIGVLFSIGVIVFGTLSIVKAPIIKTSEQKIEIQSKLNENNIIKNDTLEIGKTQKELTKEQKKLEKQKQKELKLQSKLEKKQIKAELKAKRKEARRLFFSENKKIIIPVTIISIIILLIIILIAIKIHNNKVAEEIRLHLEEEERLEKERLEKVHEIAAYFIEHNDNPEVIAVNKDIVSEYEKKRKYLEKEINKAEKDWESEASESSFLNFGHKARVEEKADLYKKTKSDKARFERNNQDSYLEAKRYLDSLPNGFVSFYLKYKPEILQEYELLTKNVLEEQEKRNAEIAKIKQEQYQQEMQSVEEKRKLTNKKAEEQKKIDTVIRAISDWEDYLVVLRKLVQKNKKISFELLKECQNYLDKIEDLKDYIPNDSINNVERSQRYLEGIIAICDNKEELTIEIQEFKISFTKILNKEI